MPEVPTRERVLREIAETQVVTAAERLPRAGPGSLPDLIPGEPCGAGIVEAHEHAE